MATAGQGQEEEDRQAARPAAAAPHREARATEAAAVL